MPSEVSDSLSLWEKSRTDGNVEGEDEGRETPLGLLFPVVGYLISHYRDRSRRDSQLKASSRLTSYFPSGHDSAQLQLMLAVLTRSR